MTQKFIPLPLLAKPLNLILKVILLTLCILGVLSSCTCKRNNSVNEKNKVNIKVVRFEKDLFAVNPNNIANEIPKLKSKYGEFFDLFSYKIIQLGSPENPKYPAALKTFITDSYMNFDYNEVMKIFPTVAPLERDLNDAFDRYHQFFPNKKIPKVFTCISGWNQSVITTDTILAIALDKYLGRKNDIYKRLTLDYYMCYAMQKEYILPDCMRDWGYTEFGSKDTVMNVLGNMLYEGKIIYFMKQLLPSLNDSIIFAFSPQQLKWCKSNSAQMWTFLIEHKILFSTEMLTIRKLIYPAPFTNFFTKESPGRAVVWIGYKIVDEYMKHNKNISLPKLMQNSNYQEILRESEYKP